MAVFYNRTATTTMINEVKEIKESASLVEPNGVSQVPMFLFISNGSGTGIDKEKWRSISKKYISKSDNAKYIELDCPHYVHDYIYIYRDKWRDKGVFEVNLIYRDVDISSWINLSKV